MSEVGAEPIRGLPGALPSGERILWQGEPQWTSLARRAFHVRSVAIYFFFFIVLRGATAAGSGATLGAAVVSALWVVPLAALGLGILAGLAWLNARTTVYTITNRRVVLRYGVAIPMTVNIPFRTVDAAAVKIHAGGAGDLPLRLSGSERLAYAHLWPHARPWRFNPTEPMMRSVPDVRRVAEVLAEAIADAQGGAVEEALAPPEPGRGDAPLIDALRPAAGGSR